MAFTPTSGFWSLNSGLQGLTLTPSQRVHMQQALAAHMQASVAHSGFMPMNMMGSSLAMPPVSMESVEKVCDNLEEVGDIERLAKFLWSLAPMYNPHHPQALEYRRNETILRAQATVCYYTQDFKVDTSARKVHKIKLFQNDFYWCKSSSLSVHVDQSRKTMCDISRQFFEYFADHVLITSSP